MESRNNRSSEPTRRQFIRRAVAGASLLGMGSAAGLMAEPAKTQPPPRARGRELDKKFAYDISALTKVDPKLIRYAESGQVDSGFAEIRSVAIGADGQVYVAGDQSFAIFDRDFAKRTHFALDERPRCIAAGPGDLIYIGMVRHVQVYNAKGLRLAKWENLGANAVITSIAAAPNDIFVADAGNRVVVRYDASGKQLGLIGKKNPTKDVLGFVVPSPYFEVGLGPDGLLWVVNPARHRIEAYNFDGGIETAWGESSNSVEGFCGCCNPIHFTRLPDGRFVTSEKGVPRVKVYSSKGEFESVVAAPDLFPKLLENPRGIKACMSLAVDSTGRVLVADSVTQQVRIFAPKA